MKRVIPEFFCWTNARALPTSLYRDLLVSVVIVNTDEEELKDPDAQQQTLAQYQNCHGLICFFDASPDLSLLQRQIETAAQHQIPVVLVVEPEVVVSNQFEHLPQRPTLRKAIEHVLKFHPIDGYVPPVPLEPMAQPELVPPSRPSQLEPSYG